MSVTTRVDDVAGVRTLGRDLGPAGRLVRVVAGLASIGGGGWLAADEGVSAGEVAAIGGYLLLISGFYLALAAVLPPRLLGRISPWTATTLFLTPVVVLGVLPAVPGALRAAIFLYYGVSLLLIAAIRYGGCEVVGIPMLLLRRRDVVYCPLNAVDAVERPLTQIRNRPAALVAAALVVVAVVVLGVDEFVAGADWLPVDARWAIVLLAPAAGILARHAWRARRGGESPSVRQRTGSGLGAFTLAAAGLVVGITGSMSLFFGGVLAVMLVGGVVAAIRQVLGSRSPARP